MLINVNSLCYFYWSGVSKWIILLSSGNLSSNFGYRCLTDIDSPDNSKSFFLMASAPHGVKEYDSIIISEYYDDNVI